MSGYKRIIVPVVEGVGEVRAVPELLRRYFKSRQLYKLDTVENAVQAPGCGGLKCAHNIKEGLGIEYFIKAALGRRPAGILVVLDADNECVQRTAASGKPGLGPELQARAQAVAWHGGRQIPVSVVVADREFEVWYLAAWEEYVQQGIFKSSLPEDFSFTSVKDCKGKVGKLMGVKYSPTAHQKSLATSLPFSDTIAKRAPSFGKLLRELDRLAKAAFADENQHPTVSPESTQ